MSYEEVGIHTCLCGLETIADDGVCLICKAKGKNRKPIYGIIGEESEEHRAKSVESENQNSMLSPAGAGSKLLVKTNGGERMRELKSRHRRCRVEGCEKYGVKEGKCRKHFNAAHGIVKKRWAPKRSYGSSEDKRLNKIMHSQTTSAKLVPAGSKRGASVDINKSVKSAPSPHPSPSRGEGKGGGDIISLLTAERDRIDQAIEVIRKYA